MSWRVALVSALMLAGRLARADAPAARVTASGPSDARATGPDQADDAELAALGAMVATGEHWRIDAPSGPLHVWVPDGYDADTAAIVVYVHGYYTTVDEAWTNHHLPEQFARSGVNAMFIACAAPTGLGEPVRWRSLAGLLATVQRETGQALPEGRVVAIGHSGAYRTLTSWLDNRGLDTIVLVDAAYGELPQFRAWTRASRRHRLIDVGDDTRQATEWLHRWLPSTVALDSFPTDAGLLPDVALTARVLYIRSSIGHMPLVTSGVALPLLLRSLWAARIAGAQDDAPLVPFGDPPPDDHADVSASR